MTTLKKSISVLQIGWESQVEIFCFHSDFNDVVRARAQADLVQAPQRGPWRRDDQALARQRARHQILQAAVTLTAQRQEPQQQQPRQQPQPQPDPNRRQQEIADEELARRLQMEEWE